MKLVKVKVTNDKSIDDSGSVDIDAITCIVGKNESGKTAFLHALNKLNPPLTRRARHPRSGAGSQIGWLPLTIN